MGDNNQVINRALICPPSSPSSKKPAQLFKSSSDQYFQAPPHTPEVSHANKKRPAPISPSGTSQDEPPTQRQRTDNSEGSSSSGIVPMNDLIVKVEEMVTMLKRVGGNNNKDLVSDPLLACFVSAQTLLMACTAELMSRSTKKGSSSKGAANGNGKKKMKKSKSVK